MRACYFAALLDTFRLEETFFRERRSNFQLKWTVHFRGNTWPARNPALGHLISEKAAFESDPTHLQKSPLILPETEPQVAQKASALFLLNNRSRPAARRPNRRPFSQPETAIAASPLPQTSPGFARQPTRLSTHACVYIYIYTYTCEHV